MGYVAQPCKRATVALFVCLIGISLVIVMAAPQARADDAVKTNNRFNVAVVMDASNSMNYTDPDGYRFDAVKQFAGLLAEQGNYLGALAFSNHVGGRQDVAHVGSQEDKDRATGLLESVPAEGYTNIGEALQTAITMIEEGGDHQLPSVVLFFSDGNTEMPTEEELQSSFDQKAQAIHRARELGIPIYSICLNANGQADISEMEQISSATNGVFREVGNADDLLGVFNAFYGLIYGTSTITLVDETFPDSGSIETVFDVPGIGVEEVNIVIEGKTEGLTLVRPNGDEASPSVVSSGTFTLLKLTDVSPGQWELVTKGVPGDHIKVNMIYNTNLGLNVVSEPDGDSMNPSETLVVKAWLQAGEEQATTAEQYTGYTAELRLSDAFGNAVDALPMDIAGDHFEASRLLEEGSYFYEVHVVGNYIEKDSGLFGPLSVSASANNTPPTPVNECIEETIYVFPLSEASYTLDMRELAKDEQDDRLTFQIVSSSFIEGEDYKVSPDDVLTLDHFSISKGDFIIRAVDSGGLFCDTEVVVTTRNVGLMAIIGMLIAGLIALAVAGILLYIALQKPFRGTIKIQSYTNGQYSGSEIQGRRGRLKLSRFGLDSVGLDYTKSYIQATGQRYVLLRTDKPVSFAGKQTKEVRIESGIETIVNVEGDKQLLVRFDSKMKTSGRAGGFRGGKRALRR